MNQLNSKTQGDEIFVLALLDAAARIEQRLERALSYTRGVSFTEYHLLLKLSRLYQGTATRVDLAAAVRLTPSAVTRALKPLEKIGLVATRRGERDARQNLATLTTAGEELLSDAEGIVKDVIADLPLEVLDQEQLTVFFSRLASL